jgi:hypothetical protein
VHVGEILSWDFRFEMADSTIFPSTGFNKHFKIVLRGIDRRQNAPPPDEALRIAKQIADALEYATYI